VSAEDRRLSDRLDRLATIVWLLKKLTTCRYGWEVDIVIKALEEATKE
jgi:hypothetical protein